MKKEQTLITTRGDLAKFFSAGWSVVQISASEKCCYALLEREIAEERPIIEEQTIKPTVRIEYDEEKALMSITNTECEKVFYGNTWEFNRDPSDLKDFLMKLGVETELINTSRF